VSHPSAAQFSPHYHQQESIACQEEYKNSVEDSSEAGMVAQCLIDLAFKIRMRNI
jgi:hypothetical protein